ncbi:helix-turn-helix DNA binding domain protein [Gordonia phage Wrigley]|nr:helix-turn-helix DNA binding domain protein [Gordonia phage Wrigley]
MLDDGDLNSAERLADHLANQDAKFLENLIALRDAAGLTQSDLAAAWGRHKTTVSQFEQPGNDPRMSTVRRYAASIGARYVHMVYLDSRIAACRVPSAVWNATEDEVTESEMLPTRVSA